MVCLYFFFFKQKTAYEMRISDWSSDVCSSDLGTHVTQKGSLVAPDRLRFDFSHFQPMTAAELAEVERRVNAEIRANHGAEVRHMDMQEALDFGAMALFGEKYGERVRVLRMGDTSRSEEHTSELQSLMRISYAVFCLKKKKT